MGKRRPKTIDVRQTNEFINGESLQEGNQNSTTNTDGEAGYFDDEAGYDKEMPAHGNSNESSSSNSNVEKPAKKSRRGIVLMTHIWNQPKETRIVVEWNSLWQPVSGESSDLAHFLGTMARNPALCSLAYSDWRLFPQEKKLGLIKIVKSKFVIPHPKAEEYVLKSMGRKWSNFKCQLKTDFYEPNHRNVRELMSGAVKHPEVPQDQWVSLVTHWISNKGKKRSETNQNSRELQVMVHTAGAKSFARVTAEMTVDGVIPSRAKVYIETHKDRKTRPAPMDKKSKEAVDMINEKLSGLPNGIEATNGRIAWKGDIYSQVMDQVIGPEREGRVRGLGMGPTPSSVFSNSSSNHFFEDDEYDHDLCYDRYKNLECRFKRTEEELLRLRNLIEKSASTPSTSNCSRNAESFTRAGGARGKRVQFSN